MSTREQALQTMHDIQQVLKLLLNLVGSENNEHTHYFLQMAVKGVVEKVLTWNDPRNSEGGYYSIEIDVLIMKIFFNLVNSGSSFDSFDNLLSEQHFWLLQRFASLLSHSNMDVRRESLSLFTSILRSRLLPLDAKHVLLQRLDLIRTGLYMLQHDAASITVVLTLSMLESCFYKEADELQRKLRKWERHHE